MSGCRGHMRHWFAPAVGVRSPTCVRCGAPNPRDLSTDDWEQILAYWPELTSDPWGIAQSLADAFDRPFEVDKWGKLARPETVDA